MRVLIPLSQFFPGGQTTHVVTLAKYLKRVGHEVTLAHIRPTGPTQVKVTEYKAILRAAGVELLDCRPAGPSPLRPFRWDVIHAHSTHDWSLARSWSIANHVPFVLTVHGLGCSRGELTVSLRDASAVIAVGKRVAASVSKVAPGVTVIENGVDARVFRPAKRGVLPNIVFMSRLDSDRLDGLRALLDAVALLGTKTRVYVVSDRPARQAPVPAGDNVVFAGWTHSPEAYLNAAHIVVGSGRVIREGMASGCACVVLGTRYGGPVRPEGFKGSGPHDFSGRGPDLPVPTPEAIAADVGRLLSLPLEARARLGRQLRRYAIRHFGGRLFAGRNSRVYEEAVRAFRRRSAHRRSRTVISHNTHGQVVVFVRK